MLALLIEDIQGNRIGLQIRRDQLVELAEKIRRNLDPTPTEQILATLKKMEKHFDPLVD